MIRRTLPFHIVTSERQTARFLRHTLATQASRPSNDVGSIRASLVLGVILTSQLMVVLERAIVNRCAARHADRPALFRYPELSWCCSMPTPDLPVVCCCSARVLVTLPAGEVTFWPAIAIFFLRRFSGGWLATTGWIPARCRDFRAWEGLWPHRPRSPLLADHVP